MSGSGRYDSVGRTTHLAADGRQVPHLQRRFLPQPGALGASSTRIVSAGERVDLIAAQELADAERSWLLADASAVMRPSELSVPGAIITIPRPGGIEVTGGK